MLFMSFAFRLLAVATAAVGFIQQALAFDISQKDNLAVYWGQNSGGNQGQLSSYCNDNTIDTIILAFLYVFFGPGPTTSAPEIDFGNICSQWDNSVFPGTALADCSFMASQIKACQAKGKIITLSLGGATGQVGFSQSSAATSLADKVWNMFLGGSSSTRPFGSAVLDGVDLDIESGNDQYYDVFVNRIRSNAAGASKKYYITAAPQCPYPDASIGAALNAASFDAVYVQFYNNYCQLSAPNSYNFGTWDNWAKKTSHNKNIKVYIGAPAASEAAAGYVGPNTLGTIAKNALNSYSSFGGVMLWDVSEAVKNNNFHKAIKSTMVANVAALAFTRDVSSNVTIKVNATAKAESPDKHEPVKEESGVKSRFFRL